MFRFFALSAAALLALTAAAQAGQHTVLKDGKAFVSYSDLDLTREDGARVMLKRIKHAADAVCGGDPYSFPGARSDAPILEKSYRQCLDQAVANAVAALKAPAVTHLYAQSKEQHPDWYAGR